MLITELTRPQLDELKQSIYTEQLLADCGESPSYGELAQAPEIIQDWEVFEQYANTEFTNDDFWCTAGL